MAGRPRDPKALKVIRGTFRGDRNPKNEPEPGKLDETPKAPSHLNRWGKALWKRTAAELVKLEMLTAVDLPALELLCDQYGIYRELKDAITHTVDELGVRSRCTVADYLRGRNSQTMPEYSAMKTALEKYRSIMTEFGLSPASRNKIDLPSRPQTQDPMEELVNGG
jgi:P27 family predicted phage terminase small subunit